MMDFFTDHPFLTMSVYILMLTAGAYFLVDRWMVRAFKRHEKRMKDEHSEYPGHESYRGGSDD